MTINRGNLNLKKQKNFFFVIQKPTIKNTRTFPSNCQKTQTFYRLLMMSMTMLDFFQLSSSADGCFSWNLIPMYIWKCLQFIIARHFDENTLFKLHNAQHLYTQIFAIESQL